MATHVVHPYTSQLMALAISLLLPAAVVGFLALAAVRGNRHGQKARIHITPHLVPLSGRVRRAALTDEPQAA